MIYASSYTRVLAKIKQSIAKQWMTETSIDYDRMATVW